jgi:hypothetical protein
MPFLRGLLQAHPRRICASTSAGGGSSQGRPFGRIERHERFSARIFAAYPGANIAPRARH